MLAEAFVPERSKGVHSSCTVFVLVGSNPTECMVLHRHIYFGQLLQQQEYCFVYLLQNKDPIKSAQMQPKSQPSSPPPAPSEPPAPSSASQPACSKNFLTIQKIQVGFHCFASIMGATFDKLLVPPLFALILSKGPTKSMDGRASQCRRVKSLIHRLDFCGGR